MDAKDNSTAKKKIFSLDFLRAFFSVCVVLIHLGFIYPSSVFSAGGLGTHTFTVSDFINFYVLYLAVPIFFLISTYLFALKPFEPLYFRKRIFQLAKLVLFWSIAYNVYRYTRLKVLEILPDSISGWVKFLLHAGDTVYYFFLSLAILIVIAHFAKKLSNSYLWIGLVLSLLLLGVLPVLAIRVNEPYLVVFWNPLNFLSYPFVALLAARYQNQIPNRRTWFLIALVLAVGAALLAILDWTVYLRPEFIPLEAHALPSYTRPSLVFLTAAVLVLALNVDMKPSRIIGFMSDRSLALYCLHPFILLFPAIPFIEKWAYPWSLAGDLVVVVLASYLAAMFLGYFLQEDLL